MAQLFDGTGAGADVIGKTFEAGDIPINQKYRARFKGFATNTYAEMTILEVQRSDQGTFQLDVAPKGSGSLSHNVELVVQKTATTQFIEKPPTPSFVEEGQKIVTLMWSYTLDGELGLVHIFISTDNRTESIGKTFGPGKMTIEQKYQARFSGFATNTYAEITILEVQRSDQGTLELHVTPKGSGSLSDNVELVVQKSATTQFIEKPPTPSFVEEGQKIVTLMWNYTLDGELGSVHIVISTGNRTELIGKTFGPGKMTIEQKYQARFRGFATISYAEITILEVQRSDQGTLQLHVTPKGFGSLSDDVELVVQTVKPPTRTPTPTGSPPVKPPTGKPTPTGSPRTPAPTGSRHPPAPAAGEAHTLTCQVDGNPAPKISWYNGSEASGAVIANGKQLKVTKSGCYTCSAHNSLGPSLNLTYCVTSKSSTDATVKSTSPQPLKQQVTLCGLLLAVFGLVVHV